MITYSDKLATPEWLERREKIKARDGHACVLCGAKKPLHVHHLRYVRGKEPWEYPDEALVTLCAQHHAAIHDETMHIQAENVLLAALRRAKINSLEIIELTAVCLRHETEFSKRIERATKPEIISAK
jgi:5-methylcytosine-specific restriction endonuclease McrA